jgi:hypothetical protein
VVRARPTEIERNNMMCITHAHIHMYAYIYHTHSHISCCVHLEDPRTFRIRASTQCQSRDARRASEKFGTTTRCHTEANANGAQARCALSQQHKNKEARARGRKSGPESAQRRACISPTALPFLHRPTVDRHWYIYNSQSHGHGVMGIAREIDTQSNVYIIIYSLSSRAPQMLEDLPL